MITKTITKDAKLAINRCAKSMPMVGWHNPYATFTHKGKEWEIAIAGGCQAIAVTPPKEMRGDDFGYYAVEIKTLLPIIVAAIEEDNKRKRVKNE